MNEYDLMTRPYPGKVSFGEAVKNLFVKAFDFNGRATRSEYWWAFLFNFLVSYAAGMLGGVVSGLVSLVLLIPGLSLGIRRLHDTDKSWVWILLGLIPLAGAIILIVFYCQDSVGDNRCGLGKIQE